MMRRTLSALPAALQAAIDNIAKDPGATANTKVMRRSDAFVTYNLEQPRVQVVPRITNENQGASAHWWDSVPGGLATVIIGSLFGVAILVRGGK